MRNPLTKSFWQQRVNLPLACAGAILALSITGSVRAAEAPTIGFGVPTWPGVTVKSEIAAQIIATMGYETKQTNASPSFALNSLKTGDLDIYLGGWMPTEKPMIDPLVKKREVKVLATNISDAIMGIAVPKYVWDAGVHSEADLAKHADKFENTIYGIEAGSGFNDSIKESIANDRYGLGGWQLIPSSTSAMLAQVDRAIDSEQWIVFLGWEPHWMNATYEMKYLKAKGEPKIAATRSDVLTVVNPNLVEERPEIAKYLKQYVVKTGDQSAWVLEYSKKERAASEVASEWIGAHLDTVGQWLEGVKTRDGTPAVEAVRNRYGG